MNVSPAGGGNVTSPDFTTPITAYPAVYTCSTAYTLTATPNVNAGFQFIEWIVNATRTTVNPLLVSVADGTKNVTAVFRAPAPPNADAGGDQTVIEEGQVTLDGSRSSDPDNDITSYLWQQTAGTGVTLSNASAVRPTFTAPEVSGNPETLTFQLTVRDRTGLSDTDTVTITVADDGNAPPTADAGGDQTVTEGNQVTLDGSGSFDPNDDITGYLWQQTAGTGVTLSDPSAVNPTFTAPVVSGDPLTLTFQLTVEDITGLTDIAFVSIIVNAVTGDDNDTDNSGGGGGGGGCFISDAVR